MKIFTNKSIKIKYNQLSRRRKHSFYRCNARRKKYLKCFEYQIKVSGLLVPNRADSKSEALISFFFSGKVWKRLKPSLSEQEKKNIKFSWDLRFSLEAPRERRRTERKRKSLRHNYEKSRRHPWTFIESTSSLKTRKWNFKENSVDVVWRTQIKIFSCSREFNWKLFWQFSTMFL